MNNTARNNPFSEVERTIVGDIFTSHAAMETLSVLCDDCGARFAGTEEEARAAVFIASRLDDYGLQGVTREAYKYQGWRRGDASLNLLAPFERALDVISLPYSPAADLESEVVSVGTGTPEEFEALGDRARGKILMAHSRTPYGVPRWIHRKEKYDRAFVAGAAAFLFISEQPGLGPETGSLMDDAQAPIPGVSIPFEHGALIERLIERGAGVRLRLRTTDIGEPMESWNVVGELRGNKKPEELVILGSHYDGHDIAQGALDPASGTIVVIEAARVLAEHAAGLLDRTVRFVLFGTEELGLTGAYRYVQRHAHELDNLRFMLNLDSAGAVQGDKGVVLHDWPGLEPFFEQAGREMGAALPVGQNVNAHSDHFPFFLAGVASGWMGDPTRRPSGRGWGHTRFDTFDKVDETHVRMAAANAARLALRIANADEFPAARRSRDEVAEIERTDPNLEDHRVGVELRAEMLHAARAR